MLALMRAGVLLPVCRDTRASSGTRRVVRRGVVRVVAAAHGNVGTKTRTPCAAAVGVLSRQNDAWASISSCPGSRRAARTRVAKDDKATTDTTSSDTDAGETKDTENVGDENAKENENEVVGVEVKAPATLPADAKPASALAEAPKKTDAKKTPPVDSPGPGGGDFLSFVTWLTNFLQPGRLLSLFVNGALFLFAAQFMTIASGGGAGATHVVPVSYSRFLSSVKNDDVSTLSIDGQYLTWRPKTPFVIKRQGTGVLSMQEEQIQVAYSGTCGGFPKSRHRPFDALYGVRLRKPYHYNECTRVQDCSARILRLFADCPE